MAARPAAWSRRGDKIVFRSEDIHGTVAKLRRDVPDYLYGSGTKGNVIVFEADELQKFLGVSILSKKSPCRPDTAVRSQTPLIHIARRSSSAPREIL